jgi:hypothetical protein
MSPSYQFRGPGRIPLSRGTRSARVAQATHRCRRAPPNETAHRVGSNRVLRTPGSLTPAPSHPMGEGEEVPIATIPGLHSLTPDLPAETPIGWESAGVRIPRRNSRLEPLNRSAAFTPLQGSNVLPHRLLKRRKRRAPMIRFMARGDAVPLVRLTSPTSQTQVESRIPQVTGLLRPGPRGCRATPPNGFPPARRRSRPPVS